MKREVDSGELHFHLVARRGGGLAHLLAGLDDLVDEEQLRRQHSGEEEVLLLDAVAVPDALGARVRWQPRRQVEADGLLVRGVGVLQCHDALLDVEARVLGQDLGDDEERVGEGADAERLLADRRSFLKVSVLERGHGGDLERAAAGDDVAVLEDAADGAEAVAHRVLDLLDDVLVRPLEEERAGERVGDLVDERVVLLAQRLLVDAAGVAEVRRVQVVKAVDCRAAAGQRDALHVAALGAPRGEDALFGQHVERERVDTLLVDHDERLALLADAPLELDHLPDLVVCELALRLDELLALLRVGVVKPRRDFALLVLERDVARQNMTVLERLGHVRVPRGVVQHEAAHERRVGAELVLHRHHLDHVQVNRVLVRPPHRQHGVHHALRHHVGDVRL
mmetsp:Transcript_5533/g.17509  ORF Transcript_5533/g.17509 Transcript_5533/m.17509 type:complete len:395 (-) Transcript_5533:539-1723(-)